MRKPISTASNLPELGREFARLPGMPSSVVHTIDYEAERRTLTVTFTTGRVYRYYRVEPEIYEAFKIAASKGRFFNLRIRDHYRFQELNAA